ncbi:TPA_asm: RNA-directed RNA polymerase [ssRNA phage Gerhypos.2_1]|uniref:RNA-directed RNA polymerase n=2 Tax=Leviviricetes TaxID=2842243 RepID=A0A8S5KXP9_9VIRU|nr:RNA-directed RNA polymerase [ssRNA phage Gerhypos.2_1]QDH88088.1 MAG: RNA-dependent RNA polymerase [Leviviridae sp.]DAD50032.1 TPA_asm: RNA-directed RNA polymerase [ssRNA phage Gerhypos.2_1]
MKSLTSLWSCMSHELGMRCCTSTTRDITTVTRRTEHEGLSFLAITLADYGKVIQKWLDHGHVVPSDAPAFARKRGHLNGLPVFLQGFLGRVFDPCSGALLNEPDIEAIYALRQLTLGFSKIALPELSSNGKTHQVVTPERERRAMSDFVQCEQEVKFSDSILDPLYKENFRRMSEMLFGEMFDWSEEILSRQLLIPKHGPGAVADRLSSNAKYNQQTWTNRLQSVFLAEDYLTTSRHISMPERAPRFYSESATQYCYNIGSARFDFLEPKDELPVRVITVPKTLKTPRIIAIEPTCMQYMQQALKTLIVDGFQRFDPLSSMIGTDDQTPNRRMAMEGSLSGDLATLDLSEASDRVSNQHVLDLFSSHPLLLGAVQATRSRKADVPGHGVLRLAKFASMGSALCFPVEAMVFLTIIFLGIEREHSAPLSGKDIESFCQQVRVFGDDLIVPRDYVLSVVDELHTFGYRVNIGKSFWTGRFRESCGREYYDGQDISIVKIRQLLPTRRQDASGVIAAVSLRNQLYWAGLWRSADWMDTYLRKLIHHFPNVSPSAPLLGRESVLGYQFQKLDPYTHGPLVKGYYVSAKPPLDPLEGSGALLKCLLKEEVPSYGLLDHKSSPPLSVDVASVDTEHLRHSGRPERVNIKLGWRSPF